MLRLDIRRNRDPVSGREIIRDFVATPQRCSASFEILATQYKNLFAGSFSRTGKPMSYLIVLVGYDVGDTALKWIAKHPADSLSTDVRGALYQHNARADSEPFSTDLLVLLRDIITRLELPMPEMVLTSVEPVGFASGDATPTTRPYEPGGTGYLEQAIAADDALTLDQKLSAWLQQRTVDQNGQPRGPYHLALFGPHPLNREHAGLAFDAIHASSTTTLQEAVFAPAKATFGPDLPCGEWALHANDQAIEAQTPILPGIGGRLHTLNGYFPLDLQIPANYGEFTTIRPDNSAGPTLQPHPDWEVLDRWLAEYAPIDTGPDRYRDAVFNFRFQILRACAHAKPTARLMPSIAINAGAGVFDEADAYIPYFVDYMLDATRLGAREFYFFAPNWNADPALRAKAAEFIAAFNRAFLARQTPRNRMARNRRSPRGSRGRHIRGIRVHPRPPLTSRSASAPSPPATSRSLVLRPR